MTIQKGEKKYIGLWSENTKVEVIKEADQNTSFDENIWNYQFFDNEEELGNWYNEK